MDEALFIFAWFAGLALCIAAIGWAIKE